MIFCNKKIIIPVEKPSAAPAGDEFSAPQPEGSNKEQLPDTKDVSEKVFTPAKGQYLKNQSKGWRFPDHPQVKRWHGERFVDDKHENKAAVHRTELQL